MEPAETATDKRMRLRYPGVCRVCGVELAARQEAIYERASKTVRCVECPTAAAVAGEARRELEMEPESAAASERSRRRLGPARVRAAQDQA